MEKSINFFAKEIFFEEIHQRFKKATRATHWLENWKKSNKKLMMSRLMFAQLRLWCQGLFRERFAQIIQGVSHLGSAHPVLKLHPPEFLDDWPMLMDRWTTPQSIMMMERCWWRRWFSKKMLNFRGLVRGNRWWRDFWNLVIHFPQVSVATLLCTRRSLSKSPSLEGSNYKDPPTGNYTDIWSVLTIKTHVCVSWLEISVQQIQQQAFN